MMMTANPIREHHRSVIIFLRYFRSLTVWQYQSRPVDTCGLTLGNLPHDRPFSVRHDRANTHGNPSAQPVMALHCRDISGFGLFMDFLAGGSAPGTRG